MERQVSVGIMVFNEVEVLDFAGPFEVLSLATNQASGSKPFAVYVISQTGELVQARNGLLVKPCYSFADAPALDILIIPGGFGAEEIEIHNETVINWIKEQSKQVKLLASVCTGAFLLAEAELLDNKVATTHWMDIDRLEKEYPKITVRKGVKYVDEDTIITAAGISAGLDMSFHIVKRFAGAEIARATAKRMEYDIVITDEDEQKF